ncbi:AEC family transporter [Aliamphritea hakodatensis]|uniref:AEC family transporter n=1 Tax=Aliamphritea hakodatensis TaxID=2895352 RepID=UPI0022FD8F3D|nr:AEC family transporter [Aliamphritea hakodatensis]
MQDFTYIVSLTSPTFLLIGLGFLVVRLGYLSRDAIRTFGWFVINFGLPAAMFKALSSRSFQDILHFDYLLIFGLGSLLSFLTLFGIARLRRKSLTECAMFGLGGSLSNSLMIGFPIIMQLFGEAALVPFALTLIVENFFILPLALALADTGQQSNEGFFRSLGAALPQLLKNPVVMSIGVGLASALTGLQPPAFVGKAIDMLAMTVGGLALFTIGGMLVGLRPAGMVTDISVIVLGKLILHPLCIVLMIILMPPMPALFQSVALVLACMPMFSIYAVFGLRYNMGELCSAVLLPATLLAFFSINLMIWLVGAGAA